MLDNFYGQVFICYRMSMEATNVVFEASTQTPTNEECTSPIYSQKGHLHKSSNHCENALTNIHKMRQTQQVTFIFHSIFQFQYFRSSIIVQEYREKKNGVFLEEIFIQPIYMERQRYSSAYTVVNENSMSVQVCGFPCTTM